MPIDIFSFLLISMDFCKCFCGYKVQLFSTVFEIRMVSIIQLTNLYRLTVDVNKKNTDKQIVFEKKIQKFGCKMVCVHVHVMLLEGGGLGSIYIQPYYKNGNTKNADVSVLFQKKETKAVLKNVSPPICVHVCLLQNR